MIILSRFQMINSLIIKLNILIFQQGIYCLITKLIILSRFQMINSLIIKLHILICQQSIDWLITKLIIKRITNLLTRCKPLQFLLFKLFQLIQPLLIFIIIQIINLFIIYSQIHSSFQITYKIFIVFQWIFFVLEFLPIYELLCWLRVAIIIVIQVILLLKNSFIIIQILWRFIRFR